MEHQDWNVVTWRKPKKQEKNTTILSYMQSKHSKLDNSEESFRQPELSHTFRTSLQKARVSRGLSQKDLANMCHINVSLIQAYEKGTSVPTPHIRTLMNRNLKATLPKK